MSEALPIIYLARHGETAWRVLNRRVLNRRVLNRRGGASVEPSRRGVRAVAARKSKAGALSRGSGSRTGRANAASWPARGGVLAGHGRLGFIPSALAARLGAQRRDAGL
jgi:hypothetical protein